MRRARHPRCTRTGLLAAAVALVLAPGAVTTVGASFTTRATAPAQTAAAAQLSGLTGITATYGPRGTATVSWDTPTVRPDTAPVYTIERSIGGTPQPVAPLRGTRGDATAFSDDITQPATIEGKTVTSISAGYSHSCAIADGAAYCWGKGEGGRLGNNSTSDSSVPVAVDTSGVLEGKTLTAITAGGGSNLGGAHSCAIDAGGAAYCWGEGADGQLGNNGTGRSSVPVAVDTSGALEGKTLTAITAGASHSCAIDGDGVAYCWGYGYYGQLGNNSTDRSSVPVRVHTSGVLKDKTLTAITAGSGHSCAIDSDGVAYCWGDSARGQLGNNSTSSNPRSVPVRVHTSGVLKDKTLTAITAGNGHSCAVDRDGVAYCWGYGAHGQLGNNSTTSSSVPVTVMTSGVLTDRILTTITVQGHRSCALDTGGIAYCWGIDTYGQLGSESTGSINSSVPVVVDAGGVLAEKTLTALTAADSHSCAIDSDGVAYCWGYGGDGRLGNNSTGNSGAPVPVEAGGVLGNRVCASNWLLMDNGSCAPGPDVTIAYEIAYTVAGWSPSHSALVTATWEDTP